MQISKFTVERTIFVRVNPSKYLPKENKIQENINMKKSDHALIKSLAAQAGMSISAFVIAACNEKARMNGIIAPNDKGIE
jgi:hypothetical protein